MQNHQQPQRSGSEVTEMAYERGANQEHAGRHVLQPGLLQVVTWQMPVMFLTSATICMIVGLFLHIWSATPHVGRMGTWDDDSKVRKHTIYSLLRPTVKAKGLLAGFEYERTEVMERGTLSLSGNRRTVLILCVLIGRGYVHGCGTGRYRAVLCRSSCVIFAYSQVIHQLSSCPRFRLATTYGFCSRSHSKPIYSSVPFPPRHLNPTLTSSFPQNPLPRRRLFRPADRSPSTNLVQMG